MNKDVGIKEVLIKALIYLTGTVIMAFSITLFMKANVGSDPLTIFYSGLSKTIGKSYGTASIIGTGIILVIAFIIARKHIYFGTIAGVLVLGPCVDMFTPLTERLFPGEMSFFNGFILMIIAQIILCLSLGLIISARFGISGSDAILFKITEISNLKYQNLKVGSDVLYTISGVIMGGVIGIGSLVSIATTGYLVVIFIRFSEFCILRKIGISNELNDLPIKNPFRKIFSKKIVNA